MSRPCYQFRPNLQNPEHCRAWEMLQAVPAGKRSAYLVGAILKAENEKHQLEVIRTALREELQNVKLTAASGIAPQEQPDNAVPEQMLDFLGSFLDD